MVVLSGCTTISMPENTPVYVIGIPKSMIATNWYRDYCANSQPTNDKEIPYGESCKNGILLHAYMHTVKIYNPRNEHGDSYETPLVVALTGAKIIDFTRNNRKKFEFILQLSPKYFFEKTGIKYMATSIKYNKVENCLIDLPYIHSDLSKCPDRNFHKINKGVCLSLDKLKGHYNEY